jgi:hypothetical protein
LGSGFVFPQFQPKQVPRRLKPSRNDNLSA